MTCEGMRPDDLAKELGLGGKELRDWLRKTYPRQAEEHGTNWYLTHQQVQRARRQFEATL